jgi:TM2 domain-containing membrane protein YozV
VEHCPDCLAPLEGWEVNCLKCGRCIAAETIPVVAVASPNEEQLNEAYQQWLSRGKEQLEGDEPESAVACFHEATRRAAALSDASVRTRESREFLAVALERSGKAAEAAAQYLQLAKQSGDGGEQKGFEDKAGKLQVNAEILLSTADLFAKATPEEAKVVQLFCGGCKRPLSESEVYGFRKSISPRVRCLCLWEGTPLAKHDHRYAEAIKTANSAGGKKRDIIKVASEEFPDGKKKLVAGALALLLGNFGAHKFYLGERDSGFFYLMFCWTLIPWVVACFQAIQYFTMSQVTFNLNYNIEQVLARVPAETSPRDKDRADIFSMEFTVDEEDFVDEFTEPKVR